MNSINFIGRAYFQGEEHVESVWKMRTSLLTGFTLMTGGFAGSLVGIFYKRSVRIFYLLGKITPSLSAF